MCFLQKKKKKQAKIKIIRCIRNYARKRKKFKNVHERESTEIKLFIIFYNNIYIYNLFHFHLVKNYFNENFDTSIKCNQTFLVIKKLERTFWIKFNSILIKKKKIKADVKFDINTHLISEVTYQPIGKKILFSIVTFWFFI